MENNKTSRHGMGLCGVLTVVFVVLKLTGLIKWSWGLVLMPLWVNLGILFIALVVFYAVHRITERRACKRK